jgi:hypothetical protein
MALTLADVTPTSQRDQNSIYTKGEWPALREVYRNRRYWYDGDEWKKEIKGDRDEDGELALKFPLQINPIAKVCRIHRAVMLGMQPDIIDTCPITTLVNRATLAEGERQNAEMLDTFLARVWYDSNGPAIQEEACLLMQFYGGHVWQITWEPWNVNLQWRIGIRSYATPEVFYPVQFDPTTYELLDCYIGYEIDPDFAHDYYKVPIKEGDQSALYLEHWTRSEYQITVNGIVPTVVDDNGQKHEYQGENAFGVIPIVYHPHERDGNFWGRSLVDGDSSLIGLAKEQNARMADKGDSMQESIPIPWLRNARGMNTKTIPIRIGEKTMVYFLDLGNAQPIAPNMEPEMGIVQSQGMPQSIANYVQELQEEIRRQADVASVAYGDDDVSGGRITGPVTAYRMWPTMMHTMTERKFGNMALTQIARIVTRIALERRRMGKYELWKAPVPTIDTWAEEMSYCTQWQPMIPIEQSQKVEMLNNRLREKGISLLSYLRQLNVQDPEAEAERIWEDRERQAKIDADAKAQAMQGLGGGMFGGGGMPPQGGFNG